MLSLSSGGKSSDELLKEECRQRSASGEEQQYGAHGHDYAYAVVPDVKNFQACDLSDVEYEGCTLFPEDADECAVIKSAVGVGTSVGDDKDGKDKLVKEGELDLSTSHKEFVERFGGLDTVKQVKKRDPNNP